MNVGSIGLAAGLGAGMGAGGCFAGAPMAAGGAACVPSSGGTATVAQKSADLSSLETLILLLLLTSGKKCDARCRTGCQRNLDLLIALATAARVQQSSGLLFSTIPGCCPQDAAPYAGLGTNLDLHA